jgi:hypothetical protein
VASPTSRGDEIKLDLNTLSLMSVRVDLHGAHFNSVTPASASTPNPRLIVENHVQQGTVEIGSMGRRRFGLSNSAQIPSSHASRNYLEAISRSPKCGSIRPFDKGSDISV